MFDRKKTFSIIIFGLAVVFFTTATTSFAQVPQVPHVIIVLEENTDYADVCGPNNTSMPFLCSLKSQGSFSANYYSPTHPSIGNYVDLGWGVVTTNDDGCNPNTCGFPYTGDNIVREVQTASKTWKGYAESLPSTCYFGGDSGSYAVRHSPIPYISDVQSNCLNRFVAFEDPNLGFAHDLANNTLPNYAFITPNLCDDGHDCTLPGSLVPDQWLQNNVVQPLLSNGHLNPTTGDTVLIVTFDESNADNTNGGGLVYWFMMGKGVKQNYQSTGPSASPGFYAHESTLRVMAEMVGASFSGLGGAASAPDMAEFFGTSNSPTASVSPTSLTFAGQMLGTSSAAQGVTLSNTGSTALTITGISASGDFAEADNCGTSLAAGGNCAINVTFMPTASGTRTGTLNVADNASGSPQTVSLTGTGIGPTTTASLSPTALTFASQNVGTTSASQTVTLTNTGSAALAITGISASGDFAETDSCGSSVGVGANCAINVTFTPTASGTRSGTLSVADNTSGSPQSVKLTGTGAAGSAPVVSLSPSSLTFASQTVGSTSAAQAVTLSNTGNASLTITGLTASGDFAETNTCGSSVAAGANCAISVTFTPTASGTRTGTLSVTDNASGSPQSVKLTGTGSSSTGDFSLSASPTSGTITAGQSAAFTLNVSPSGGFSQTVSLACSGAPQAGTCTISPSSVTLNGSSVSTTNIMVTTTARGMLGLPPGPRWIFPRLPAVGKRMELTKILWLMATLALLGLLAGRRGQVRLTLGFALLVVALGAGCTGTVKSTMPVSGTPAGTYTLTLTGASGAGSSATTHSINVTVTVN
jgi:Phosphoesterase family/Abnormal spindle-like microcephaly-assoc'd, ASPM-SPD-2-Hydin